MKYVVLMILLLSVFCYSDEFFFRSGRCTMTFNSRTKTYKMEKSCFGKSVDVTRIICEALPYMVKEKRKKTGSVYIAFLSSKEEPDILRGYDVEDNQIMGYGDADFAEDLEAGLFSQCEVTQTMNVTTKCSDGEKFERQKNGMTCD